MKHHQRIQDTGGGSCNTRYKQQAWRQCCACNFSETPCHHALSPCRASWCTLERHSSAGALISSRLARRRGSTSWHHHQNVCVTWQMPSSMGPVLEAGELCQPVPDMSTPCNFDVHRLEAEAPFSCLCYILSMLAEGLPQTALCTPNPDNKCTGQQSMHACLRQHSLGNTRPTISTITPYNSEGDGRTQVIAHSYLLPGPH